MRRFSTHALVPVLGALLVVTGFVACGGGDGGDDASRHQAPRSSHTATPDTSRATTPTTAAPAAPAAPTAPAATPTTAEPVAATPAPDPCDTALVHDAIAGSGAVGPDITFEVTYLKCAEGYAWARILADFGEGATAFLEGSGDDFTVLDLGTAVCPTYAGMPEAIAAQLAPEGSNWRGECT